MTAGKRRRGTLSRRQLLRLAGAGAAACALGAPPIDRARMQAPPLFHLADEKYLPLYAQTPGRFFQSSEWVALTKTRLTWPRPGEKIPPLSIYVPYDKVQWVEAVRKASRYAEQLGLRYEINLVSLNRWLEVINSHCQDLEIHGAVLRPERVDPSPWLTSRAYGLDPRNYGEQVLLEYDAAVEQQNRVSEHGERLAAVQRAQRVLSDDYYMNEIGWGPTILEGYNSAAFAGIVPVKGFGIANFSMFHSFLSMRARTARKRLVVGSTTLLTTTNILSATNTMRNIGPMIYDPLAFLSPDLQPIPWALQSWRQVDGRTWDLHLRPGMTFHDGHPVTIHDLKFTFDFMMKYDRGVYWAVNQYLQDTRIVDERKQVLRVRFKQPYGPFETYFLQLNIILPRHIWADIMQREGTNDPLQLRVPKPIGSGPFKFGQYQQDVSLQLIGNESHFSHPSLEELWIVVRPSVDAIIGGLQSGEIDMADSENVHLTPTQVDSLKGFPHLSVVQTPDINWLQLVCRISVLPWRDYEFRRAWMHAFDREYLVQVPWEGGGRRPTANTFLVDGNPWNDPNLPAMPQFNLDRARQILQAAGYSWARDGRLVYPHPDDPGFRERVRRVSKPGHTWGGLQMLGG